jgi:putative DNA primase/helicase
VSTLAALGIELKRRGNGRQYTACPECAKSKPRARDDALKVTVQGTAYWFSCFRCGWAGSHMGEEDASTPLPEPSRRRDMPIRPTWNSSREITLGTVPAIYLERRGCALPHRDGDLRWLKDHRHPSGYVGPCLVALVTHAIAGEDLTLHRTWIAQDGSGKAQVDKPRLLWPGAPKAGGIVRLWPDAEVTGGLAIGEGIETALALARAFGTAWSTLDAGGMAALPALPGIESLTVAVDHDAAGLKAWSMVSARWVRAGREVRQVLVPCERADFADYAVGAA